MKFQLVSSYKPCGDQPQAIESLAEGLENGFSTQVLLGVTGSGKTFTMANVIEKVQRPALVIAHNKTLAAQLCNEFREFFPHNRVEFFVSYYDYYQPEAYIPRSDTYIEKELEINDEIDKLRHSATSSLCEREDVIVVASVSCIYGLGAPLDYYSQAISLRYQCLQQLLQQVACPGIQPYKGIVQYQDLRISQQSLGELKLTHLATGQQDDVFVQQRTDTEDIEQPLLPLFVFGIRHQSTHQRRRLHILRVPPLLIVMSTVGIAIRVAESDILDVITYQPGGRRQTSIRISGHASWMKRV